MTDEQTTEPAPEAPAVDEKTLDAIRAAEAAQQASVCDLPDGDRPKELVQALDRRVEVNLAQYDGQTITRVGGSDPEVRRLEAPWSRRVAPATTDGDSHRRRSTKKKSTRKGSSR